MICQSAITMLGLLLTFSPCWFWIFQPEENCWGGIWVGMAREDRGSKIVAVALF